MGTPERPDEDLVRCIACGRVYALASDGGRSTSACPKCGAVSWIALSLPRPRPVPREGRKFSA